MGFNVIGVGEVLWDMLDSGPQLGGAPTNFAYHAHALGANSQVITRVGNDDYGREIFRRFDELTLPVSGIQIDPSAPTGTAAVTVAADGMPHFVIQENVAWDFLAATPAALATVRAADAICFGSLAQRTTTSRDTIQQLVGASPSTALRVFDINLRQQYFSREVIEQSLRLSNVFKLNDDELRTLAEMFGLAGPTEDQMEELARRFNQRVVALTRGPNGSLLYAEGRWSDCRCRPVTVVDTVGAGDSFTAALVVGLLHKMDPDEINALANEVACYVCSHAGGTPVLPAEFAEKIRAASPQ
jgi:fructokinase